MNNVLENRKFRLSTSFPQIYADNLNSNSMSLTQDRDGNTWCIAQDDIAIDTLSNFLSAGNTCITSNETNALSIWCHSRGRANDKKMTLTIDIPWYDWATLSNKIITNITNPITSDINYLSGEISTLQSGATSDVAYLSTAIDEISAALLSKTFIITEQ